jgi:hypothetical protein
VHPHNTFFVVAELQHLAVTDGLKKVFKDTQWTVEQLSFEAGHKSASASVWHALLLKFGVSKEDRVKISPAPTESELKHVCVCLSLSLCRLEATRLFLGVAVNSPVAELGLGAHSVNSTRRILAVQRTLPSRFDPTFFLI